MRERVEREKEWRERKRPGGGWWGGVGARKERMTEPERGGEKVTTYTRPHDHTTTNTTTQPQASSKPG